MQRDSQNAIDQACAVPYRMENGRPEFCLITTTKKGKWTFPKGIVERGETPPETALKEAREEAGLHGEVEGDQLGRYTHAKNGRDLRISAYLMRVTDQEARWDEAAIRKRRWCDAEEARKRLCRKALCSLLDSAMKRIDTAVPAVPSCGLVSQAAWWDAADSAKVC